MSNIRQGARSIRMCAESGARFDDETLFGNCYEIKDAITIFTDKPRSGDQFNPLENCDD